MSKQHTIIILVLLLFLPSLSYSLDSNWGENLEQAKIEAKQSNKYIFVDFSGSDWCHWCIQLEREVLDTVEFKQFAKDNLVLVSVDFPKRKQQSQELKKRNNDLARYYHVRGFPTVVMLNPNGELVAKTGYRRGGATAYVEHLKKIIGK